MLRGGQIFQDSKGQLYMLRGQQPVSGKVVLKLVDKDFNPRKDKCGRERIKLIDSDKYEEWLSFVGLVGFID